MSEDFDKYLAIANHDIQTANNMGELKSYVASILYDNDKKAELLQQKENKIEELMELYTTERHVKDDYKNIIREVRDLFYEKCRIKDSDGRYSFNETDIDEFRNLLDKESSNESN